MTDPTVLPIRDESVSTVWNFIVSRCANVKAAMDGCTQTQTPLSCNLEVTERLKV